MVPVGVRGIVHTALFFCGRHFYFTRGGKGVFTREIYAYYCDYSPNFTRCGRRIGVHKRLRRNTPRGATPFAALLCRGCTVPKSAGLYNDKSAASVKLRAAGSWRVLSADRRHACSEGSRPSNHLPTPTNLHVRNGLFADESGFDSWSRFEKTLPYKTRTLSPSRLAVESAPLGGNQKLESASFALGNFFILGVRRRPSCGVANPL